MEEVSVEDDALLHDWVIEQFLHRVIGVQIKTARVEEYGSWMYTSVGAKELALAYDAVERGVITGVIPRFRQGQRFTLDSAMTKATRLRRMLPNVVFRCRNVVTGDILMADILGD